MRSVSIRTKLTAISLAIAVVLCAWSATPFTAQPSTTRLVALEREPGQPPLERRLRSMIRRFITSVLGELDLPHP